MTMQNGKPPRAGRLLTPNAQAGQVSTAPDKAAAHLLLFLCYVSEDHLRQSAWICTMLQRGLDWLPLVTSSAATSFGWSQLTHVKWGESERQGQAKLWCQAVRRKPNLNPVLPAAMVSLHTIHPPSQIPTNLYTLLGTGTTVITATRCNLHTNH